MLSIYFGSLEDEVYDTPAYFEAAYDANWLASDLSRKMIKDIDNSDVLGPYCIQSPVLGQIPPTYLSGGVQTLILMAHDDSGAIFNASMCGDNCIKWILEIAKHKDLTVTLHHIMGFDDIQDFEAKILNNGRIIHGPKEYVDEATDWL